MTKSNKPTTGFTKKHVARLERERAQTRLIMITTVIVIIVVVGMLGFGILSETVLKPNTAIVTVNDDKASLKMFQEQARYARVNMINQYGQTQQMASYFGSDPTTQQYFTSQLSQIEYQLQPSTLGQSVLTNLIEDLLIRQEAKRRGITVTKEELDAYIQEQFGFYKNGTPTPAPTVEAIPTSTLSPLQMTLVPPTPTPTPEVMTTTATPTPTLAPTPVITITATPEPTATPYTESGFNTDYTDYIKSIKDNANVSEATLRYILESSLYRNKVKEAILAEMNIPRTEDQVWARHILVKDEATAQEVVARLNAGEDFATLAKELSTDSSSAQGGDVGWFSKGQMVTEFETAAWSMAVGQISEPVKSQYGYHIIQVLGHEERPLSDSAYKSAQDSKFQEWLDGQRQAGKVVINDAWIDNVPTEPALPTN